MRIFSRVSESGLFRTIFYHHAYEIAIDMKRERPDLVVKVFFPDNIFSDDLGLVEIHFRETHSMGLIDERCDEAESAKDLDEIMCKIFCEKISEAFSFIDNAIRDVVDDMQNKNGGRISGYQISSGKARGHDEKKDEGVKNKGCKQALGLIDDSCGRIICPNHSKGFRNERRKNGNRDCW